MNPTLYTGGATGADKEWIDRALTRKDCIKIYHFDGVKHTRIETLKGQEPDNKLIEHNFDQDHDCRLAVIKAAEHMNTSLPTDSYHKNLIMRDYYLVKETDSLYAVGNFGSVMSSRLGIEGHTGWIVEMFLDHYLDTEKENNPLGKEIPIFFYCQTESVWYTLLMIKDTLKWNYIKQPNPPTGKYLGIGSRDLSMDAKMEITYL